MKTGEKNMMSNEVLVKEYKATNSERVLQDLINQNYGTLKALAVSYARNMTYSDVDDLLSESYMEMLNVINDFDESRGYAFNTLLRTYVSRRFNAIYNHENVKKRQAPENAVSLNDELSDELGVACVDISVDVTMREVEFRQVLAGINFNEREQVAVEILMAGGSKMDIAKSLNITPATVSYYIKSISNKFKLAGAFI